jgi:tetratricopeptide (TPR) repeat protein
MSLLIDAQKKSQLAQNAKDGGSTHSAQKPGSEPYPTHPPSAPDNKARIAGQNLFNAKSSAPSFARARINRNLLIALSGTVLLLTAGAGYVWYAISPSNTQPTRPVSMPVVASPVKSAPATTPPQGNLVPQIASTQIVPTIAISTKPNIPKQTHAAKPLDRATSRQVRNASPLRIEQHKDESIDPLLNDAYLAYRSGKFERAQQLYREVLKLDANNTDALLGMAVIAQRRGADNMAANYYAQVMALDPRNAVANAGMSALSTDDNRESRLKTLLNEQRNSSSLHFALGNYYAVQSRWSEAQQAYSNAYKLEPDNAELAFNLAVSLEHLGQKKTAAQYYQRALQLDPGNNAGFDHANIPQRIEELTH